MPNPFSSETRPVLAVRVKPCFGRTVGQTLVRLTPLAEDETIFNEDFEMHANTFDQFDELKDVDFGNAQFDHHVEMDTLFPKTLRESNRISYFIVCLRVTADFGKGVSSIHSANKKMVTESELVEQELDDFTAHNLSKLPLSMLLKTIAECFYNRFDMYVNLHESRNE